MPDADLVVAVDQGSSSTKVLLVDRSRRVVATASVPVETRYPQPGWVEQLPDDIWHSVLTAVGNVLHHIDPARVAGLALSTQRESLALWDRTTGAPAYPLVSWQDQRTRHACEELLLAGHGPAVRAATGLPLDPMFSGTRASWLFDHVDPSRRLTRAGGLALGTVDAWLIHRLTGRSVTDVGNASRTQLLDLASAAWDEDMLDLFGVPWEALPEVAPSSGPFPAVRGCPPLLDGTPVLAVLADSHAALFGHGAWSPGRVKATYGTGSSVMGITEPPIQVPEAVCLTLAWGNPEPVLAVEGNIRSSGSTLAWLARVVGRTPAEMAEHASSVSSSEGVVLVPGFGGLAAPYWDGSATGHLTGLTFGTGLAHLARAALDSVALQVTDVVRGVEAVAGPVTTILADGGGSANADLMQLQADVSGCQVAASDEVDLSALGTAHLAGVAAGLWSLEELAATPRPRRTYEPRWSADEREAFSAQWQDAVSRTLSHPPTQLMERVPS